MAEARSVIVVSDYTKTRNTMRAALAEAADCRCAVECVDRDEFNKRRLEIQTSLTRVVFAFPRQERYLIYDKSDPYNTLQREIDAVAMIFVQYKEDVDKATLIHSDLVKLLQYGAQKDLLPYLKQGRVLSLKEEFNAYQWAQIERLFNIPIKEEIKQRKERIQLEKELAEKKKKEKEDEERQKKQAKAIKDEVLSKEDDERTTQPMLEPLKPGIPVPISDEQEWKEVVQHFEKNSSLWASLLRLIRVRKDTNRAYLTENESRFVQTYLQKLSKENLESLIKATGAIRSEFEHALLVGSKHK